MNKNCIIIHGCPYDVKQAIDPTTQHWMPWLKKELETRNIRTKTPLMPEPWAPSYMAFKKEFEKYPINEMSALIGHSCGCAFLVRWLGDSKQKIDKLILVAPWKVAIEDAQLKVNFYNFEIDNSIKNRVNEITIFTADNEEIDGKKSLQIYHNALGGEVIELKNHGHYCLDDMGTEEFPELLEKISGVT